MDGKTVLANMANVTALGRGLDKSGEFSPESMEDTYKVLKSYSKIIEEHEIAKNSVIVTATEASRVAKNAKSFFERIEKEIGLRVTIISGEQEAFFSTKGVLSSGYDFDMVTIMDIGGASTELIKARVKPFEIVSSVSIPIGAVRVNDSDDMEKYINDILKEYDLKPFVTRHMIATAGTMTSLAAMMLGQVEYDDEKVHDSEFTMNSFENFGQVMNSLSVDHIGKKYPFLGKRSVTIKAGYLIARDIMKIMDFSHFMVSSRGLRYGTIDMEVA
jgi:exopolyphosphatase/guanosine-5'-triphosphate,3'-diphosphate pyrophosphatase